VLYYNLIIAEGIEVTKANLKLGIPWRFGPNWPGQRCEARTRRGTLCQRPGTKRNGKCRLHGGRSTGPTTKEGRARLAASKIKHGRFTKEKREEARRRAQVGRELRAELTEIENWFLDRGLLDKMWRDQFKITN
jgi:hypothetical protein